MIINQRRNDEMRPSLSDLSGKATAQICAEQKQRDRLVSAMSWTMIFPNWDIWDVTMKAVEGA